MINNAILSDEIGATAIEYGLIAGLIALGIIGGVTFLGEAVLRMWEHVSTSVIAAMP